MTTQRMEQGSAHIPLLFLLLGFLLLSSGRRGAALGTAENAGGGGK